MILTVIWQVVIVIQTEKISEAQVTRHLGEMSKLTIVLRAETWSWI